mmetsp:Transcript_23700/g.58593  ORF Transcript_23700/g.58593 Transcript_23700/m.58593 type:complete len:534 (-) Transcript_23700:41-1642(-)
MMHPPPSDMPTPPTSASHEVPPTAPSTSEAMQQQASTATGGGMMGGPPHGAGPPGAGGAGGSGCPPVEVKLFVGRVPRTMNEDTLRVIFSAYGDITDVAIIRDRETQAHKGCAFVRYASITSADAAVRALNNIKVLDQSLGPLTIKYAVGEHERLGLPLDNALPGVDQAKLFVGSLPKTTTESDIQRVFEEHGTIEEVFIMRDNLKQSKGCAFVKFAYKEQAFYAIQQLNGKVTLPNSDRPIEVRFAENKRTALSKDGGSPYGQLPGMQEIGAEAIQPYPPTQATPPAAPPSPWREYFTHEGRPYYHNQMTGVTQWDRPPEMDAPRPAPQYGGSHLAQRGATAMRLGNVQLNVSPTAAGSQTHGPPGSNLFIFHIPNEWSENDLIHHFAHYGHIISARITTDKATGRNRGFGFVSFDNPASAANAVIGMNGFSVAGKRLKVQIKKGEEHFCSDPRAAPAPHMFATAAHPPTATSSQAPSYQPPVDIQAGMMHHGAAGAGGMLGAAQMMPGGPHYPTPGPEQYGGAYSYPTIRQ